MLNPQKNGFEIRSPKNVENPFGLQGVSSFKDFSPLSAEIPNQKSGAAKKHSKNPVSYTHLRAHET